jgi:lipopolysaccharide export LptBFGC system permease protein LptF
MQTAGISTTQAPPTIVILVFLTSFSYILISSTLQPIGTIRGACQQAEYQKLHLEYTMDMRHLHS